MYLSKTRSESWYDLEYLYLQSMKLKNRPTNHIDVRVSVKIYIDCIETTLDYTFQWSKIRYLFGLNITHLRLHTYTHTHIYIYIYIYIYIQICVCVYLYRHVCASLSMCVIISVFCSIADM